MNSQHRPEDRDSVVPEPTAPGPAIPHFVSDWFRFGDVALLALTHFVCQRPIIEQNVALVIEFEASAIHISATDQRYLATHGS